MEAESTQVSEQMPRHSITQQKLALERQLRRGANWFFWIAALSVINTAIYLSGSSWSFIVGLGITQIIDVSMSMIAETLGADGATIARLIGLGTDFIVICIFLIFGLLARKRFRWLMIIGMAIYALDAVIFVVFMDVMSILFHLLALYYLWRGLQAIGQLRALEKKQHAQSLGIA